MGGRLAYIRCKVVSCRLHQHQHRTTIRVNNHHVCSGYDDEPHTRQADDTWSAVLSVLRPTVQYSTMITTRVLRTMYSDHYSYS